MSCESIGEWGKFVEWERPVLNVTLPLWMKAGLVGGEKLPVGGMTLPVGGAELWAEPDALLICARLLEIKRRGSRSVPKSPRAARFARERVPGRFTASGYSIRTDMAHLTTTTILDRCGLGRCGEFCREL